MRRRSRPHLAIIAGSVIAGVRALQMGGSLAVSEQLSAHAAPFTIPRQAVIEGAIHFAGALVVTGTVEGDVTCTSLVVSERGVINGSVAAETVTVLGEVNGEISATTLTLKAACSVTGDIFHKRLVLEDGCYFEGRSRRLTKPLALVS